MRAIEASHLITGLIAAACGAAGVTSSGIASPGVTGSLVNVATMSSPRAAHTATTLRDGRVLLVGGIDGAGGSAELFDPKTRTFVRTVAPNSARSSHSATLLGDGRVLIAGGFNGQYLSSTEIYDPKRGIFEAGPEMREPRSGHVSVTLRDGRVVFIGGVSTGWTFLASAEVYDPRTNQFTETGSMSVPRESHVATLLADGTVMVIGGHNGRRENIQIHASAERYDPERGTFVRAASMTRPRHKHAGIALADGRVLIAGGADERDDRGVYGDAEVYDPVANRFSTLGTMRRPRYKHAGTLVPLADGTILLAGGSGAVEVFDPVRNTFSLASSTSPLAGSFSAVARLTDGSVLITGGYGNGMAVGATAWLYLPNERSTD